MLTLLINCDISISSYMKPCYHLKELNEWQVAKLREHLSKHRYYLGEKGIYLDDKALQDDFLLTFFTTVAKELRSEYCSSICETRKTCELAKLFLS